MLNRGCPKRVTMQLALGFVLENILKTKLLDASVGKLFASLPADERETLRQVTCYHSERNDGSSKLLLCFVLDTPEGQRGQDDRPGQNRVAENQLRRPLHLTDSVLRSLDLGWQLRRSVRCFLAQSFSKPRPYLVGLDHWVLKCCSGTCQKCTTVFAGLAELSKDLEPLEVRLAQN